MNKEKEIESPKYIVYEEPLMSYSVTQTSEGFIVAVKVHGKTVNEWNMGLNEEVAQSKATHLIDTYSRALDEVQSRVREIFAEEGGE